MQLVQNEWDPTARSSRMRMVRSFGREERLDRATVERLAGSLGHLLAMDSTRRERPLSWHAGSVAFGSAYLLDQL